MPNPWQARGTLLVEDRRTERFFRHLIECFGGNLRRVRVVVAPAGSGSAEAWVRKQYPQHVQFLRSNNFQNLFLLACRDGDAVGVVRRKAEMDEALRETGKPVREPSEAISLPVPTWSIENWLLALLGEPRIDEGRDSAILGAQWKHVFEQKYGDTEGEALKTAASAWSETGRDLLPSLADGREEFKRIWI